MPGVQDAENDFTLTEIRVGSVLAMKRYAIVVEDAGTNWAAHVPELPGCIATGATFEEVEQLIQEAIELHLEGMVEDGVPIPEPSIRVDYVEVNC